MRRVWMIRAGVDAEAIDTMRLAGSIGLRYETVGDPRGMADLDIEKAIASAGAGFGSAAGRAMLLWFANDVNVGDLVVSPNIHRREIWLGIVTSDYRFDEDPAVAHYQHVRDVDWLGWLDRDLSWMKPQLKSIERQPVMFELYSRDWWWNHVGSKDLKTAPRTRAVSAAASARSGSSKLSTPRVRKAAAPAKPKAAPPVLCAGSCGLVWSPYVLVDGLCADCRLD